MTRVLVDVLEDLIDDIKDRLRFLLRQIRVHNGMPGVGADIPLLSNGFGHVVDGIGDDALATKFLELIEEIILRIGTPTTVESAG